MELWISLNQGYGIHELKVSDIAAAAGIGKVPFMSIFQPKRKLSDGSEFYVYKEYEAFTALVSNQHKFEDVIYKILNHMVDMLKTRFSSLLFMVVSLGSRI